MSLRMSFPNFKHRLVMCSGYGFRQAIASAIDPQLYSDDGAAAKDWPSRIAHPKDAVETGVALFKIGHSGKKHRTRMRNQG